jgi:hypothetical protein
LEDVVYPAESVGKRIRYRLDGAKVIKVYSATSLVYWCSYNSYDM